MDYSEYSLESKELLTQMASKVRKLTNRTDTLSLTEMTEAINSLGDAYNYGASELPAPNYPIKESIKDMALIKKQDLINLSAAVHNRIDASF